MTTQELVDLNKGLLNKTIVSALNGALLSSAPFLFAPVLNVFTNAAIDWIANTITSSVEIRAFYLHTDIRVSNQGKRYTELKFKIDELEKTGDVEGLKNAQIELEKCFVDFVSFRR